MFVVISEIAWLVISLKIRKNPIIYIPNLDIRGDHVSFIITSLLCLTHINQC